MQQSCRRWQIADRSRAASSTVRSRWTISSAKKQQSLKASPDQSLARLTSVYVLTSMLATHSSRYLLTPAASVSLECSWVQPLRLCSPAALTLLKPRCSPSQWHFWPASKAKVTKDILNPVISIWRGVFCPALHDSPHITTTQYNGMVNTPLEETTI